MISLYSNCIRRLKIGDSVVVKLLPYHSKYLTVKESFVFPIIGFYPLGKIPLFGTNDEVLYNNHHFFTVRIITTCPQTNKWKYCMRIDEEDIRIERIRKKYW
jgi:hypothetical protein